MRWEGIGLRQFPLLQVGKSMTVLFQTQRRWFDRQLIFQNLKLQDVLNVDQALSQRFSCVVWPSKCSTSLCYISLTRLKKYSWATNYSKCQPFWTHCQKVVLDINTIQISCLEGVDPSGFHGLTLQTLSPKIRLTFKISTFVFFVFYQCRRIIKGDGTSGML